MHRAVTACVASERCDNDALMESLARQRCAQHPDRPSLAVCMSCRNGVCQECATPFEGIYYCLQCVAALVPARQQRSRPIAFIAMVGLTVLMGVALVRLAVGIGAWVAGLF